MIYDITLPVTKSIAAWPGDVPYTFELNWKMGENNSPVNVGVIRLSVHTGTHADAPFHFKADGGGAGEMELAPFLGPAVVIEAANQTVLHWEHFQAVDFSQTPRLLIKTGAWPDPSRFPDFVPTLAPDVPVRLAQRGVVLLGVDVPSVDAIESKDLPLHDALLGANIAILESLDLRDVPPGNYQLSALPLRLMGADGAPVRAVLWTE